MKKNHFEWAGRETTVLLRTCKSEILLRLSRREKLAARQTRLELYREVQAGEMNLGIVTSMTFKVLSLDKIT